MNVPLDQLDTATLISYWHRALAERLLPGQSPSDVTTRRERPTQKEERHEAQAK